MTDEPVKSNELRIVARAPFHIYYEGSAKSVTATNKVGEFNILPGHADFFSMLTKGDVLIETESDPIDFNINNGIIAVRDNKVMLFVNV